MANINLNILDNNSSKRSWMSNFTNSNWVLMYLVTKSTSLELSKIPIYRCFNLASMECCVCGTKRKRSLEISFPDSTQTP